MQARPRTMQTAWKAKAPHSAFMPVYSWEKTPPIIAAIQTRPSASNMYPSVLNIFNTSMRISFQGLKNKNDDQYGGNSMKSIPGYNLFTENRGFSADHVRHYRKDSGGGD